MAGMAVIIVAGRMARPDLLLAQPSADCSVIVLRPAIRPCLARYWVREQVRSLGRLSTTARCAADRQNLGVLHPSWTAHAQAGSCDTGHGLTQPFDTFKLCWSQVRN